MSDMDKFFEVLASYKKLLTWAIGPSALLPLVASFAGLSPHWPPATPMLTSLFTLLFIVLCFQFFRRKSKRATNKVMIWSMAALIVFLLLYLVTFDLFTFQIPTTGEFTYLGCGWSDFSQSILEDFLIANSAGCPGNYQEILKSAKYEAPVVWTPFSVTVVKAGVLVLWLCFFSAVAVFLGSFIVYQSK